MTVETETETQSRPFMLTCVESARPNQAIPAGCGFHATDMENADSAEIAGWTGIIEHGGDRDDWNHLGLCPKCYERLGSPPGAAHEVKSRAP